MYMVTIYGYTEVRAFSEEIGTAIRKAVLAKKKIAKDDLAVWNWKTVSDYYGTSIKEITEGTVVVDY